MSNSLGSKEAEAIQSLMNDYLKTAQLCSTSNQASSQHNSMSGLGNPSDLLAQQLLAGIISQQAAPSQEALLQQALLSQLASAAVSGTFGSVASPSLAPTDQNAMLQALLLASVTPQKPSTSNRQADSFNDVLAKLAQDLAKKPSPQNGTLLTQQIQQQQKLIQQQQQEAAMKIMQQLLLSQQTQQPTSAQNDHMLMASLLAMSGVSDQKQLATLMTQMTATSSSPSKPCTSKRPKTSKGGSRAPSRTATPHSTSSSAESSIEGTITDVLRRFNESPSPRKRRPTSQSRSSTPNKKSRPPLMQELLGDALTKFQAPLLQNWKRETIVRGIGPNGIHGEVMYRSPAGETFTSLEAISQMLERGTNQLTSDNFTFRTNVHLGDYFEDKDSELVPFDLGRLNELVAVKEEDERPHNRYEKFPGMKGLSDVQVDQAKESLRAFFNRLIEEQHKFEQARKVDQENIIKTQKERIRQMKIDGAVAAELKQPVEDLSLLKLVDLPQMREMRDLGCKMSPSCFANCLMVYEFLHCFSDALIIEMDSIPSLGTFQAALVDRDSRAMNSIVHLLCELLKYAFLDPGIRCQRLVTQATGTRLQELEINSEYVSAALRAFVVGRNGFEDEMSSWLAVPQASEETDDPADEEELPQEEEAATQGGRGRLALTVNFQELEADQQAALLEFVCSEMVAHSGAIARELDRISEVHSNLRKDRFYLENKIKKIKFLLSRKPEVADQVGEQHPVAEETKHLSALHRNTIKDWEQEPENPPSDEDEVEDLTVLEARLSQLQKNLVLKQNLIDECAYKMSGVWLGQDRFKRNYFLLGSLGGIFVEGLNPAHEDLDCSDPQESGFNADFIIKEIEYRKQLALSRKTNTFFKRRRPLQKFKRRSDLPGPSSDHPVHSPQTQPTKQEPTEPPKKQEHVLDLSNNEPQVVVKKEEEPPSKKEEEEEEATPEDCTMTFEELFALCISVGVDDAMLATSALLYVTQTGLVEKLGTNWQNAALQYQTHLTCLIGQEVAREKTGARRGPFTESILQLKVWLQQSTMDPNGQAQLEDINARLTKELECPDFLAEVEATIEKSIDDLGVQRRLVKDIPPHRQCPVSEEMKVTWWKLEGSDSLRELCKALAQRGCRERGLLSSIQKSELVESALQVDCSQALNFHEATKPEFEHNSLKVRLRRGKGKKLPVAPETPEEATPNGIAGTVTSTSLLTSSADSVTFAVREEMLGQLEKDLAKPSKKALTSGELDLLSKCLAYRLGLLGPVDSIKPDNLTADTLQFIAECQFVEEVEALEDRVLSSSLQSKGWQASARVIDDDTVRLIPRKTMKKTRVDQYPLDLAKERLLALESGLERRYLLPPFLPSENLLLDEDKSGSYVAASINLTKELLDWRRKVKDALDVTALRACAGVLVNSIAWHKSIMKVLCQICRKDNNEAELLLCDACDHGYHTYCFKPPMTVIPDGDWFCFDCQSKASEGGNKHRRRLCFICGVEGHTQAAAEEASSDSNVGARLACCELCSRCAHPDCLKPTLVRIPRRWLCAACSGLRDFERDSFGRQNPPEKEVRKYKKRKVNSEEIVPDSPSGSTNDEPQDPLTNKKGPKIKVQESSKKEKAPKKGKRSSKNSTTVSEGSLAGGSEELSGSEDKAKNKRKNPTRLKKTEPVEENQPSSPDSIDCFSRQNGESKNSITGPITPELLEYCRLATMSIISHPSSLPFRHPVNLRLVPMYKKIIKKPMDLSTVLKRTLSSSRGAYKTFKEWKEDMLQIFANCKIFNEDDSDLGRCGANLCQLFERYFSQPGPRHDEQHLPPELHINEETLEDLLGPKKRRSSGEHTADKNCATPSPPIVDFEGTEPMAKRAKHSAKTENGDSSPPPPKLTHVADSDL